MKLKITRSFRDKLNDQVEFIARDKPKAARGFKTAILDLLRRIPSNPYQYRRSVFFKSPEIRELVFKGYIIVFMINEQQNTIEVFGFTRFEENPFKK